MYLNIKERTCINLYGTRTGGNFNCTNSWLHAEVMNLFVLVSDRPPYSERLLQDARVHNTS